MSTETEIPGVGNTALWFAAQRAVDSESDDALINDPYARDLAGEIGFNFFNAMREAEKTPLEDKPARVGGIRARLIDDLIVDKVNNEGIRQVVNVAAGCSTRPYRLIGLPEDLNYYELDFPGVHAYKNGILREKGAVADCKVHSVDVDFREKGAWQKSLLAAGYDPTKPAVWSAEGLLFYLTEEDNFAFMRSVTELLQDGYLAGDLVSKKYLAATRFTEVSSVVNELGAPWLFAPRLNELEPFVEQEGKFAIVSFEDLFESRHGHILPQSYIDLMVSNKNRGSRHILFIARRVS